MEKANDPRYEMVAIDEKAISNLPEDDVMLIDRIVEDVGIPESGYRKRLRMDEFFEPLNIDAMERMAFVDINNNDIKIGELWSATWNKTFLKLPKGRLPVSEYDVDYYYGTFLSLFPYGRGIPEDLYTGNQESLRSFLKYCLNLHDSRFREHYSFLFVGYNVDRRRRLCRSAKFLVSSGKYRSLVESISNLDIASLEGVPFSELCQNRSVQEIIHGLKVLTSCQDGTIGSKMFRRNELRSLIAAKGIPLLWLTVNPNDLQDPLVSVFAGNSVQDALNMNSSDRIMTVCNDPVAAVEHFHTVITTILNEFFKCDKPKESSIYGKISNYFGMIETQSRGTLHLHILLWSDEVPYGDQYAERLKSPVFRHSLEQYLNALFSECLNFPSRLDIDEKEQRDFIIDDDEWSQFQNKTDELALKNQLHKINHTASCQKYGKQECRFGFPRQVFEKTVVEESGKYVLKRNHPYLNTFSPAILVGRKINHDIRFLNRVESNDSLSLLFYLTNYTTKSDFSGEELMKIILKAYTQCSALNCPAKDLTRRLLIRVANLIGNLSEVSAQQAVSEILGFSERVCNVTFSNLNWNQLLAKLNSQQNLENEENSDMLGISISEVSEDDVGEAERVIGVNWAHDYVQRGPAFEDYNAYSYSALVYKQAKSKKKSEKCVSLSSGSYSVCYT